jgi:hypothetical protein
MRKEEDTLACTPKCEIVGSDGGKTRVGMIGRHLSRKSVACIWVSPFLKNSDANKNNPEYEEAAA